MLSVLRAIRGYLRVTLHSRPTHREFDRLGLTPEVLEARAPEIDAATPEFAQTRGKAWADIGDASAAYLSLLRQLPARAGPDAAIAHFRRAGGHPPDSGA
jgi:hypothetical protein